MALLIKNQFECLTGREFSLERKSACFALNNIHCYEEWLIEMGELVQADSAHPFFSTTYDDVEDEYDALEGALEDGDANAQEQQV